MFQKLNLQYFFSYLGSVPYIVIILDKYLFFQIREDYIMNFLIHYTILIFVFVGAINWDPQIKLKNYLIVYGFMPSLIAAIIIVLNLINFATLFLLISILFFLIFQLLLDYILIYYSKLNRNFFFYVRVPLTTFIVFVIGIFIS